MHVSLHSEKPSEASTQLAEIIEDGRSSKIHQILTINQSLVLKPVDYKIKSKLGKTFRLRN